MMPALVSAQSKDQRAVRAAYVYNLTKLVEWPPGTNQIVVGYVGDYDTGAFLQTMLNGKSSDSRPIRVVLFPSDDQLPKCNVLYFAGSRTQSRTTLDKLGNASIVTIGEANSFADEGEMIGLVQIGDHIQMQLNAEAAQRAGVQFSQGLLNLAMPVSPSSVAAESRKIIRRSEPDYPELAAKMSLHGIVKIKALIARDGTVTALVCIGGHPVLAAAALEAVRTWRYEAAPHESTQIIEVKF
jgi:TonB family protein